MPRNRTRRTPGRTTGRPLLAGGAAIGAAFVLVACGGEEAATPTTTASATTSAPGAATAVDHNAADVMFATMMLPHHAQAVEMSSVALAKDGLDPRVAEIAEQVRTAQAPEIEEMRGWLREWGEPVPEGAQDMAGMDMGSSSGETSAGMPGGMSVAEIERLRDASGAEASRLFLEQMTVHHEGAIEMAEVEVRQGRYPAAVDLARSISRTQQEEIARMRSLLDQL